MNTKVRGLFEKAEGQAERFGRDWLLAFCSFGRPAGSVGLRRCGLSSIRRSGTTTAR